MSELFSRALEPEGIQSPPLTAIVVHGLGSNENDLLGLGKPLGLPIRLVAPRGPMQVQLGFGVGYAWYEFAAAGEPEPEGFRRNLDSLVVFVDEVRARYGVDREQLIMMGFSQGAVMSIATALSIPDKIGGVVALSGYMPRPTGWTPPHSDLNGLPMLVTHGTADEVLPVEWGRAAAEALRRMGADVRYEEFEMAHQVSPECLDAVRTWLQERMEADTSRPKP